MRRISLFLLLCFACFCTIAQEHSIRVATYNLRNDNKGDSIEGNGWGQRYPVVANLILFHDFDIMGTQECRHNQLEDLQAKLPGYQYIGVGRDDGKTKGEYAAVFYKSAKFKLLKSGNFWLSTDTEKPNLGWDAACVRICTWGEFQEIQTGFRFYFFNLHMDHVGIEARKNSARLILDKIKSMDKDTPVILTGDFNVDQINESYLLLNNSGILKDAYDLSGIRYASNGTFSGFDPNAKTESRIDHIFLTKTFKVARYGILTDTYWSGVSVNKTQKKDAPQEISFQKYEIRLPSDHYPVVADITYK